LNSLKRQEAEKDKEIQKLKKELKLKDGILARIDLRKSPEKLAAFNKKDEGAFEQEILRLHRILC
jgi:IS30 family transposase